MRLLFTTTGNAGHVLPLVPVARAARRAGHAVRVAAPRSRGAIVERARLPFWPYDDPPEDETWATFAPTAEMTPDDANAIVIGEIFGRLYARAALPGLLAMIESWRPDAVVRESYEFASAIAAEHRGVPHVRVATGLVSTEDWMLDLAAAHVPVAPIRASPYLSLTPPGLDDAHPAHPFDDGVGRHDRVVPGLDGDLVAHRFREDSRRRPAPPRLDGHLVAHRFREDSGRREAPPLPDWWPGRDGPLVYLTFGSVASGTPVYPALYRAAVAALAELPARVLVTIGDSGDPADLGPLPANVHVERWVRHEDVIPHTAALVCHGGYGTVTGGLAHGVPVVIVPLFADQPRNARRVADVGAGLALPPFASIRAAGEVAPDALAPLAGLVRQVLDEPAFARAASRIAASTRALPPVAEAPRVIESIAGEGLPLAA